MVPSKINIALYNILDEYAKFGQKLREIYGKFIRHEENVDLVPASEISQPNMVNILELSDMGDELPQVKQEQTFSVCADIDVMNYYGKV